MNTPLKVEFRIGEIEFKAEGDPADVEKQRESFVNTLLPLAVNAMVQTRGTIVGKQQYIETTNMQALPNVITASEYTMPENTMPENTESIPKASNGNVDFSRESLNTYINKLGNITDQEFVVLATYFAETKNGQIISITSETGDVLPPPKRWGLLGRYRLIPILLPSYPHSSNGSIFISGYP